VHLNRHRAIPKETVSGQATVGPILEDNASVPATMDGVAHDRRGGVRSAHSDRGTGAIGEVALLYAAASLRHFDERRRAPGTDPGNRLSKAGSSSHIPADGYVCQPYGPSKLKECLGPKAQDRGRGARAKYLYILVQLQGLLN